MGQIVDPKPRRAESLGHDIAFLGRELPHGFDPHRRQPFGRGRPDAEDLAHRQRIEHGACTVR
ncbi:MAG: hypothetical protein R3F17_00305 [Planctomycetota bacterium]